MTFSGTANDPRVEERQPRAEDPRTGRGRYEIGADPRAKRQYATRQYHGPMFKYVGLLVRLTEIAKQRDFDDPVDCANATMRKLLRGQKGKPKKNLIEIRAQRLAAVVRQEWFSPKKSVGRPLGTHSVKRLVMNEDAYDIPLSVAELIEAALPAIDELAGNKTSGLQALVATVHFHAPHAPPDSIARMASRIRARVRGSEIPSTD
jgi:hypothetical protein